MKLKIYYCSSEAYPFSKSGGLADVAAALPKTLLNHGHEIKVIIPLYKQNLDLISKMEHLGSTSFIMDNVNYSADFYRIAYNDVDYILVRNDELFSRSKYYGYEDDPIRFVFFNYAILEFMAFSKFIPQVIHINDWQTSLIPYLLDSEYRIKYSEYKDIKTLLTIHNLEKQGSFPLETEKLLGHKNFTYIHMDRLNFLKTGIMRANAINTVSESYKHEILTRFYGFDLQGPLKARQHQLFGILNGFDETLYNPIDSPYLVQTYDEHTFEIGKKYNKIDLLKQIGFQVNPDMPIISFINRLARQKGIDILMREIEHYLENKACYFIVLGKGEAIYESYFENLAKKYPDLVFYQNSFDIDLSHKVYAASDLFLLPSLFEPCGLNHMIAMKFGALPIVRDTGGLKDTVTSYNKFTGVGVGFSFKNNDPEELKDAIDQALYLYHHDKYTFNELIAQAMHVHHSMEKMAMQYEILYQKLVYNKI